jgi:hypothetical protein
MTIPVPVLIPLLIFAVIGAAWSLFLVLLVALAADRARGTRSALRRAEARHAAVLRQDAYHHTSAPHTERSGT